MLEGEIGSTFLLNHLCILSLIFADFYRLSFLARMLTNFYAFFARSLKYWQFFSKARFSACASLVICILKFLTYWTIRVLQVINLALQSFYLYLWNF